MFGPVLYLEMLLGGRRGRQYIFRWIYAGWLIAQLLFYYSMYRIDYATSGWSINGEAHPDPAATGRFAGGFVEMFVVQQFLLVLLATPAFTAGAITDEKTRGTLQHLLIAHLTAGEIVMGKLLGRLAQVGVLVLVGLPVLCFIGVFGGLDPLLLLAVLAATVVPLFALGAASVLASVWSRQTSDAVLVLYTLGGGCWLLLWAMPRLASWLVSRLPPGGVIGRGTALVIGLDDVLRVFNPLEVLEPAWTSGSMGEVGVRLVYLLLAWGGVGVGCLLLATWRLRPAYVHQLESSGRKVSREEVIHRPPVDSEESGRRSGQRFRGIIPIPMFRGIWTLAVLVLISLSTFVTVMGEVGGRLVYLLLAWGGFGVGSLLLATWRRRAAGVGQFENSSREEAVIRRPPVDSEDPVRWREQHVCGVAPIPVLRGISTLTGLVLISFFTLTTSWGILVACIPPDRSLTWDTLTQLPNLVNHDEATFYFLAQAVGAILVFSLIVGIRCSGVVSGEREKQTWEALLLTPLETRALVRGKLKGIMYAALPYLGAYAVPALAMSFLGGFLAFFWTVLGLLVTLLAMFYVGAAGLWCSATSRTSWRSLLWTLGFGYVGGFVLSLLASPFALILAAFLYLFLQFLGEFHGTSFFRSIGFGQFAFGFSIGMSICVALFFFFAARILQSWAEKWVADRERIRHWKHEPLGFRRTTAPIPLARAERPPRGETRW